MLAEFDVPSDELDREVERLFETLQTEGLLVPEAMAEPAPSVVDSGHRP
jgi:hypothetical protein